MDIIIPADNAMIVVDGTTKQLVCKWLELIPKSECKPHFNQPKSHADGESLTFVVSTKNLRRRFTASKGDWKVLS